jgi:hypothetical protein
MFILRRAPHDEFTLRTFVQLSQSVNFEHDAFYLAASYLTDSMWTVEHKRVLEAYSNVQLPDSTDYQDTPRDFYKNIFENNIKSNLVLVGTKDHYTSDHFNPWKDHKPEVLSYLENVMIKHPDKTFILFTSLESVHPLIHLPNLRIIPWGGDITNQEHEYKNLTPVTEKNMNSSLNYLSLNRNHRYQREMLVSLLLEYQLEPHGLISCMFQDRIYSKNIRFWNFKVHEQIQDLFVAGRKKLKTYQFNLKDEYAIYEKLDNDNVTNFKNKLCNYYKDTFVEIINETSFFETCFLITEKTANCIYGSNFPIWISSKGTVDFLRNTGLDVFDDIVDHSYDDIHDPIHRLNSALELNFRLLMDNTLIKKLWIKNKDRFINNHNFLKNNMHEFYKNRTVELFKHHVPQ